MHRHSWTNGQQAFAVRTRSSRLWMLSLVTFAAVALSGCSGSQSQSGPTATPQATSSTTHTVSAATMACYNLTIMSAGLEQALTATAIMPASKWKHALLRDGRKLVSWAAQLSHATTPNTQLVTGIRRAGAAVTEAAKGRTSAAGAIRDIDAVKSLCD